MGELTIISETGMFHSACRYTIGQSASWIGFKPRTHRAPIGPGLVDTSDRTASINHTISFAVADTTLIAAANAVSALYLPKTYVLGVCDCVSLSADFARQVGLAVPAVNMTPYGLILILAAANSYTKWT
jgi:hypothetical protein